MLNEEVDNFLPFDPGSEYNSIDEQLSSIEGHMSSIANTDIITTDAVIAMEAIRPGMLMDCYPQNGWGNPISKRELVIAMEELSASHRGLIAIAVGALVAALVKLITGWNSDKTPVGNVSDKGKTLADQNIKMTDAVKKAADKINSQKSIDSNALEGKAKQEYERLAKVLSEIRGKEITVDDLRKDVMAQLSDGTSLEEYDRKHINKICCNFMLNDKIEDVVDKLNTALTKILQGLPEKLEDYTKFEKLMTDVHSTSGVEEVKIPALNPLFIETLSPVVGNSNMDIKESDLFNQLSHFLREGFATPDEIKVDDKKLIATLESVSFSAHLKLVKQNGDLIIEALKKSTGSFDKWTKIAETADRVAKEKADMAAGDENSHQIVATLQAKIKMVREAATMSLRSHGQLTQDVQHILGFIKALDDQLDKLIALRNKFINSCITTIQF